MTIARIEFMVPEGTPHLTNTYWTSDCIADNESASNVKPRKKLGIHEDEGRMN